MALKDIFTMVKADRYTADGCEELNKAREAETEDKRYNIGEISQKTGLQKTANGWRPPKGAGKAKSGAPKSLAGTPMNKADFNSKDPYEITHCMKPDTASEAKEMDKISAFMQEETGATLRNAITARESFYKNTKNPTPEQQEGLAALMKIQQKLGYGKPAVESIGRDEKLNKVRQVLNTALTPSGDKVQMTKSKVTGDFHVLLNGKSTGGGFRDPQKAKEEFNAWIAGKKAPSESAKERINKRFDESEARSQKAMESKPAKKKSEYKGGSVAPAKALQGMRFRWDFDEDGKREGFLLESSDGTQVFVDENDVEGTYPKYKIKPGSAIHEALGLYNIPFTLNTGSNGGNIKSVTDCAPRVLTGDCKVRIRKA
jgi:hypothetical protein